MIIPAIVTKTSTTTTITITPTDLPRQEPVADSVNRYTMFIRVMNNAKFAFLIAGACALVWVGIRLRREVGVSRAVFALPVLRILSYIVNQIGLLILIEIVGFRADTFIQDQAMMVLITDVITAAFYGAIPLVLGRKRISESRPSGDPSNSEPVASES